MRNLHGVGDKLAAQLQKLGIERVEDLLFHLPLRYEDRTRITPIGAIQPGCPAQVEGEVLAADLVFGRRRSLMVKIGDATGLTTLRFFHFSRAQQQSFTRGRPLRCYGEVRPGRSGLEIFHPEYRFLDQGPVPLSTSLTPVYPATEGLTQQRLRKLSDQALACLPQLDLNDLLADFELPGSEWSLGEALSYLHRPPEDAQLDALTRGNHPAHQRLIMEELVAHQLGMIKVRNQASAWSSYPIISRPDVLARMLNYFGYPPTQAQQRVIHEISADMALEHPMLRLLQGDVGSGKTLVAAVVAAQSLANGFQTALMVPTEILAEQHFSNLEPWLSQAQGAKTLLLTSRLKGKARQEVLKLIAAGQVDLVIGTHALFQEDVVFARLALVIIDEQHRFGVNQRLALQDKARSGQYRPHQLVMTATPIPRTLAMSHYAHLDLSMIDELPPGRKAVTTAVVSQERRDEVIERVHAFCGNKRQAYWICTLIEEGEMENLRAAEVTAEELRLALPDLRIGLVHGRLKSADKNRVMEAFKSGEIDLLVATTVIEVGVDVPAASLMVIENPERLGLAQLHQLRGRVGRGRDESHCILLYGSPLSFAGKQRLDAMRQHNSGFELAEIDLRLRGAGELLGLRQAGQASYHLVDLERDAHLLPRAARIAKQLIERYPERADRLIRRWMGGRDDYSFS